MPALILVDEIHANLDWFGDKTNFKAYFSLISAEQLFRQPELAMTLSGLRFRLSRLLSRRNSPAHRRANGKRRWPHQPGRSGKL